MNLEYEQDIRIKYAIIHYTGSLDYPCYFCQSHAYNNYHFMNWHDIEFVVCKECLLKAIDIQLSVRECKK